MIITNRVTIERSDNSENDMDNMLRKKNKSELPPTDFQGPRVPPSPSFQLFLGLPGTSKGKLGKSLVNKATTSFRCRPLARRKKNNDNKTGGLPPKDLEASWVLLASLPTFPWPP